MQSVYFVCPILDLFFISLSSFLVLYFFLSSPGGCWWVLVGGLEGAGGCFSCLGFVGFLGPDFMGGADQVTAWNVFSVTPQSLSHLTMQWHI